MGTPHPSDKPDPSDARTRFLALLRAALADGAFERLVLARPTSGEGSDLRRVAVRPVLLRGERCLQFVHTHATRDVTKNLDVDDGVVAIDALIGVAFAHAHLQTTREAIELRVSRKGRVGMSRHTLTPAVTGEIADAATAEATAAHDRAKRSFVDIGRPWLVDLGVTDAEGRLVPSMARKWKQINKFVEVFYHAFATSALAACEAPVRVVEFGSG